MELQSLKRRFHNKSLNLRTTKIRIKSLLKRSNTNLRLMELKLKVKRKIKIANLKKRKSKRVKNKTKRRSKRNKKDLKLVNKNAGKMPKRLTSLRMNKNRILKRMKAGKRMNDKMLRFYTCLRF